MEWSWLICILYTYEYKYIYINIYIYIHYIIVYHLSSFFLSVAYFGQHDWTHTLRTWREISITPLGDVMLGSLDLSFGDMAASFKVILAQNWMLTRLSQILDSFR